MRQVENLLIVRICVDGRHKPTDNLPPVVDNLRRGGETVGCAGCIGDYVVVGRIVVGIIDTDNDRDIFPFCWSGDNDLLCSPPW